MVRPIKYQLNQTKEKRGNGAQSFDRFSKAIIFQAIDIKFKIQSFDTFYVDDNCTL